MSRPHSGLCKRGRWAIICLHLPPMQGDGSMTNGQMTNEQMTNEQMTNEQMTNEQMTKKRLNILNVIHNPGAIMTHKERRN